MSGHATTRTHYDPGTRGYDALGYSPDDVRWAITEAELAAVADRLGRSPRIHTTPGGLWLLIGPDDTDVYDAYAGTRE